MAKDVKAFVLYTDNYAVIKTLTLEQKGMLLDAIFQYNLGNEEPEESQKDPVVRCAFEFMKVLMARSTEAYNSMCEKNRRNILARWHKNDGTQSNETVSNGTQSNTTVYDGIRTDTESYETIQGDSTAPIKEKKRKEYNNTPPTPQGEREFVPPSLDDVQAYCAEKELVIDPEEFWNNYEGTGWMQGGSHVQRWKSLAQTWNRRELTRRGMRASKKLEPKDDIFAGAI